MPRNRLDDCMFCSEDEPCEVHQEKPKKSTRRSAAPKPVIVTPPVDLKAAMKAAIKEKPALDPELGQALVVLEPILSKEALDEQMAQLSAWGTPADRWKWRRNNG